MAGIASDGHAAKGEHPPPAGPVRQGDHARVDGSRTRGTRTTAGPCGPCGPRTPRSAAPTGHETTAEAAPLHRSRTAPRSATPGTRGRQPLHLTPRPRVRRLGRNLSHGSPPGAAGPGRPCGRGTLSDRVRPYEVLLNRPQRDLVDRGDLPVPGAVFDTRPVVVPPTPPLVRRAVIRRHIPPTGFLAQTTRSRRTCADHERGQPACSTETTPATPRRGTAAPPSPTVTADRHPQPDRPDRRGGAGRPAGRSRGPPGQPRRRASPTAPLHRRSSTVPENPCSPRS